MMDESQLLDIDNIINERGKYGTVKIHENVINERVTWIGNDGYTDSVGQWIRIVERLRKKRRVQKFYRFKCSRGNGTYVTQNHYYYGAEFHSREQKPFILICGGTTDYSGEGNYGRSLAEAYMEKVGSQIVEMDALNLISLLTM